MFRLSCCPLFDYLVLKTVRGIAKSNTYKTDLSQRYAAHFKTSSVYPSCFASVANIRFLSWSDNEQLFWIFNLTSHGRNSSAQAEDLYAHLNNERPGYVWIINFIGAPFNWHNSYIKLHNHLSSTYINSNLKRRESSWNTTLGLKYIRTQSCLGDVNERQTVRESWLSTGSFDTSEIIHLFPIGTKNISENERTRLENEASEHRDLVFLETLTESFDNLAKKVAYSFEAAVRDYDFDYLLKTDTDSFVRIGYLLKVGDILIRREENTHPI